jgi:hypothetical protein
VLVNYDARMRQARPIPQAIRTAIETSNQAAEQAEQDGQAGLDTIPGA